MPSGRPPIAPSARKVRNITFRSRGDMYEKLRIAAASNHRSLSEEIERRLEKSLDADASNTIVSRIFAEAGFA